MGGERESARGRDRSEKTESEDRTSCRSRGAEASAQAALEQDHEESDRTDLLERDDRQLACRGDAEQTRSDADRQERRRARQAEPLEERNGSSAASSSATARASWGKKSAYSDMAGIADQTSRHTTARLSASEPAEGGSRYLQPRLRRDRWRASGGRWHSNATSRLAPIVSTTGLLRR